MFFGWDTENIARYLMSLHENIKVLTHPKNVLPIFWSHHEKIVVID